MSIFSNILSPRKPAPALALAVAERSPSRERRLLIVGQEFDWLNGEVELAGRKVVRAGSREEALGLLKTGSFEGLIAGLPEFGKNIALADLATAAQPAILCGVRGDAAMAARFAFSYPLIPATQSLEVMDDIARTMFASARWNADPCFAALKANIGRIPALPALYTQITTALQSEATDVGVLAELVSQEPAISTKVLQVVNSPIFALRQRITSIRDAATFLGFQRLRALVLSTSLVSQCDASRCPTFVFEDFEIYGLQIANWAATIAIGETRDRRLGELAFTAGLLHQFGILLLATNLPESYNIVLRSSLDQRVSVATVEREVYGVTNAELAGFVFAAWNIPFPIVNAVGFSAAPSGSDDDEFSPLAAVHLAVAIDTFNSTGRQDFDRRYLDRLKLVPRLNHWSQTLAGKPWPGA